MRRQVRHLISIDDLSDADLSAVAARGAWFATQNPQQWPRSLDGVMAGIHFRKTSTRTRCAFIVGALRLGAQTVVLGPGDLQTNTGETTEDTSRVLSRMLDVLVARTTDQTVEMRGWASQDRMAVVNAMSHEEHPTQALADLTTLLLRFNRINGLHVLYVGEGNNTAAALALALTRFRDVRLQLRTPPGYGLEPAIVERAGRQAERYGASLVERHDMAELGTDIDVIYTTRWETTGTTKPDPQWRDVFAPFQVTGALWQDNPKATFMHDLPAHRGQEVTAEVLDGPASIAFDQAESKLFSAMAALEWALCR
jgi:ornithine carbamoyltransferase